MSLDKEGRGLHTWLFVSDAHERITKYGKHYTGCGLFNFFINPTGEIAIIEGGYNLNTDNWDGRDETLDEVFWEAIDGGIEYTLGTPEYQAFINKWATVKRDHPHLTFYLTLRNDGAQKLFESLAKDWFHSQENLTHAIRQLMNDWTFIDGIDMDLERGALASPEQVEGLAEVIYHTVKERDLLVHWCLPPMTGDGAPYWEAWCRYEEMETYFDHCVIMSYAFSWSGSAHGPIQPQFWMDEIYAYVPTRIPKEKLSMGVGAFGFRWDITRLQTQLNDGTYENLRGAGAGMPA